jgi:protein SCO1/2
MGKGVKPLLFSLSLLFFFLYAGGWDPLEPSYQQSLPTVIKYGCLNITLPKAVLYNQYGEAVEFPPRGVYILSFGYTYCPDVCPLTFAVLNATWRLSKLPIYVVSVDPERDTPDRLRAFAEGGRYPFTFLTGREAERVWRAAGVYVARAKSGSGYVVYHDVLFLLVADGTARGYVAGLPDPAFLLERLEACLEK